MWNKSTSLEKKEQLNASETLLKFANYGGHILLISNIVLWQTTLYFCAVKKKPKSLLQEFLFHDLQACFLQQSGAEKVIQYIWIEY